LDSVIPSLSLSLSMPSRFRYQLLPVSPSEFESLSEYPFKRAQRSPVRRSLRLVLRTCVVLVASVLALIVYTGLFNPSYASPKAFKVPADERVFIAANIIDGDMIEGPWGAALEGLVEALGKERVFVSVYGGPTDALAKLEKRLDMGDRASIVSEEVSPIPWDTIPNVALPDGSTRIKRIAYLAEVRNRALQPLGAETFDKILFLNDVIFSPEDAMRLLFGTNVKDTSEGGRTDYKAACAVDFINPFKFYDTFATRDLEGYGMGLPFYPWFAEVGGAESRADVLANSDAVRVRSCWGGMVAFDAKYFQHSSTNQTTERSHEPIRFRSEPDPFWDASECCLIHADIQTAPRLTSPSSYLDTPIPDTGIYMNPFVRVGYSTQAYRYVHLVSRFEKLFSIPHALISRAADLPRPNPRRFEVEGSEVKESVWSFDSITKSEDNGLGQAVTTQGLDLDTSIDIFTKTGHYETLSRVAGRGGYCGTRQLLVMRPDAPKGERNWEKLKVPQPPSI
jgi:hypothetical protein